MPNAGWRSRHDRARTSACSPACFGQSQEDRARDLMASVSEAPDTAVAFTVFHALCNEPEEAVRWFDRAIDQRHQFVPMLLLTPPYLPVLRASSRWPMLARRLNLSETS